jgi:ABC-type transporter Mla subunit MlaD
MTECMKALFRAQAFHQTLDSLLGGLRRYQNPALADLIEAVAAEDRSDLDRLQRWVLELAAAKDAQFDLVDREAQRCRATLSRQPAGRSK